MNKYESLLESAKSDVTKTEMYIKSKECMIQHSKDLLEQKKKELESVIEYVYLLQTVVQGLKFAIQSSEAELDMLRGQIKASGDYQKSLAETKEKFNRNQEVVESGSFRTEAKKPKMQVQLQSFSEAVKDAASLVNADDNAVTDSVEPAKDREESSVINPVISKTILEEDEDYVKKSLSICKVPQDKEAKDIWLRRLLVKHYMESGMSQVTLVMNRFNDYASKHNVKLGSESSISKDMTRIVDGKFILELNEGQEEIKDVSLKFRPARMLTSDEICQLSGVISSMEERYKGKTDYIKQYVSKYARTNLQNMSTYKVKAVQSYVNEQMSL